MKDMKIVSRVWSIAVPQHAFDVSALAQEYADQLVDLAVGGSVQSLLETRQELQAIEEELMHMLAKYEVQSKGFRRGVTYKGKFEAFSDLLKVIAKHIEVYDLKIEANSKNDGRLGD
jgi:septum formation topological specificity factor MinE